MEIRCQADEVRGIAEQILSALKEVFGDNSSTSQLLRAFYERRQQSAETVSDFSHGLVVLVDRLQRTSSGIADDHDRMLREHVIENVRDDHLRRELKRRVEREPASTCLAIRKVVLMWAGGWKTWLPGKPERTWPSVTRRPLMRWPKSGTSWLPGECRFTNCGIFKRKSRIHRKMD
ncbi:hypothetical protein NP493_933g00041 [Ridgeia piscesae]|uniref:Paraneoplastic antigen Ma-like C-terminal domain-containing protein n=1 Tax=Ridgeia piscesae TaxID=27915 RepID=A0AAD9NLJ3_RIDPI|nr:hypothetical protein NP493_933g00041 [Ridgeia piscesae]